MEETSKETHVAILMATHNGAAHLEAQLQSFVEQTHKDWSLWVSDDGSTDGTIGILEAFREAHPAHPVRIVEGPCRGAAQNFISLLHDTPVPEGLVALSDQDDLWLPEKLSRAIEKMQGVSGPVAYSAQSRVGRGDLSAHKAPKDRLWKARFGNAMVQNIMSGHTLTLNPQALKVLRDAGRPEGIQYHDWWIYQVMAGHGATCIVDDAEVVIYRQHGANTLGVSRGPAAAAARARMVLDGTFGRWAAAHREALWAAREVLSSEAVALLRALREEKPRAGISRVRMLRDLRVTRTSRTAQALIEAAALFGRF